jgi:hypothetical protein
MTYIDITLAAFFIIFVIFWYLAVEKFSKNYRMRLRELGKMGFGLRAFFTADVKAPGESSSIRIKEGLIAEISDGRLTPTSRVTRALTREI